MDGCIEIIYACMYAYIVIVSYSDILFFHVLVLCYRVCVNNFVE